MKTYVEIDIWWLKYLLALVIIFIVSRLDVAYGSRI